MIQNLKFFSFLVFALLFFTDCAPKAWEDAEKSYKAEDYVSAVVYCVYSLREKQNYDDAVTMLLDALPKAQNSLFANGQAAEKTGNWDDAFSNYSTIIELNKLVKTLPPQTNPETKKRAIFKILNVDKYLERARTNAAEKHYQQGITWENTRYKEAAKEFNRAQQYIAGYKDASERYEKARLKAVKRIAIMSFENKSGKQQFGSLGETMSDQTIGIIMSDPSNLEFVEMVTRDRLEQLLVEQKLGQTGVINEETAAEIGKVLGIHSFIFGKVNTVTFSVSPESKASYYQEAEVYQGKGLPYKKVYANVIITTRKAKSNVTVTYQVIEVAKGTIVKSGSIIGEYDFEYKFGRFTGDVNAIDYNLRELCQKEELYPPSEDELVNNAMNDASKKLAEELAKFFR